MILLLDNQDSFVWNLAQALAVLGARVEVRRSDRFDAADLPRGTGAIVLSPGPGRPEDAGACLDVLRLHGAIVPTLGVCLGHQAIGQAYGGTVDRGEPCHGRTSPVHHDGSALFDGVPDGAPFCRYHSLQVKRPLPDGLVASAWLDDGTVMGLRHTLHPVHGVQFHPESFRSPHGMRLLANFLAIAGPEAAA